MLLLNPIIPLLYKYVCVLAPLGNTPTKIIIIGTIQKLSIFKEITRLGVWGYYKIQKGYYPSGNGTDRKSVPFPDESD